MSVYYGHLAKFLNVAVGDTVYPGRKIGQIGSSVSYENGGYWPHLHLGIEKADFANARCSGYDSDLDAWHNPRALIGAFAPDKEKRARAPLKD